MPFSATTIQPAGRTLRPHGLYRYAALIASATLLIAITRLPFSPRHLYSFDSINFAFALEHFDPAHHQPQPPGYPLFIAEAKLVSLAFGGPEATFAAVRVLISGLSVALLCILGWRIFSPIVGICAAVLFTVHPVFWFSGLTSALRPHLALVSILVAYCCWRALEGDRRYFYLASAAIGLGGGFRPALDVLLFPLWAFTAWQLRKNSVIFRGLLLMLAGTAIWVGILIDAYHGIGPILTSWIDYFRVQTESTAAVSASRLSAWRRMAGRAVIWTGSGTLAWLWTVPFIRIPISRIFHSRRRIFLALWFFPSFLFHLFVHIGNPDHALSTIPIVCLIGAVFLAECCRAGSERAGKFRLAAVMGTAVLVNLILFFGRFPLPQPSAASRFRGLSSLVDAFRVGNYESSYGRVRQVEQETNDGLRAIHRLASATERPVLVLWARNGQPVWRKVTYYFPSQPVYVFDQAGDPAVAESLARVWTSHRVLGEYSGPAPIQVPIPKGARLIWIAGPRSIDQLKQMLPLVPMPPVYFADLPDTFAAFRWGPFELVPQP